MKCLPIETLVVLLDEFQVDEQGRFIKEAVEIVDWEAKGLKHGLILNAKLC